MKKHIFLIISVIVLPGCAVRDAIKETKEQINYIEKSNKEIITKIDSVAKAEKNDLTSTQAVTLAKFSELDNRIETVENKIEDMQSLYLSSGRQDKRTSGGADSGKSMSENIFTIAYSDFTQGNYELAIAGFQKYLSDLPHSAEVYYLLGESYYAMGKETEALTSFQNILQNYPVYKKLPTVLYKLCLLYETKYDTLALQNCLTELLENYPKASESKLAKERFTKSLKSQAKVQKIDTLRSIEAPPPTQISEKKAPEVKEENVEVPQDTLKETQRDTSETKSE